MIWNWQKKKQKLYDLCTKLFEKSKPTIRFVAQVIGNIDGSFPAVPLGRLCYRALETVKIVGLKKHRQNYDAETELSNKAYSELVWWEFFSGFSYPKTWNNHFYRCQWKTGWGITDGHNPSGGQLTEPEMIHVNVQKLKVVFIGIRTYGHKRSYKNIGVIPDSSTAIAFINNKDGIKSKKWNELAKEIWLRCFKNNSFIFAAHIPGKQNIEAEKFSRKSNNNTEWQLNPKIFIEVTNNLATQNF